MLKKILFLKRGLCIFVLIQQLTIIAMETTVVNSLNTLSLLKNPSLIPAERKKYEHYFNSSKKSLSDYLKIDDPVYDKGISQVYFLLSNEDVISSEEKRTYLLHKTCKYALDHLLIITHLKEINCEKYVLLCWERLYNQLLYFKHNTQISFTTHAAFNILFQYAVLTDIACRHSFYFVKRKVIEKHLEEYYYGLHDFDESDQESNSHYIFSINNSFNRLFFLFKDPANIQNKEPLDLITFKKYFDQKDIVILPVINSKGTIGLSSITYVLSKGYGVVGFGNTSSSVHANNYPAIADLSFHDILHMYLWVQSNERSLRLYHNLGLRNIFLEKIHTVFHELIYKYRSEKQNQKVYKDIRQYVFLIFFILHEITVHYALYEKNLVDPWKTKIWISDYLNVAFNTKIIEKFSKETVFTQEIIKHLLFNIIDHYFVLRRLDPRIDKWMQEKNLKIKQSVLTKSNPEEPITKEDLIFFFRLISDRINAIMFSFLYCYEKTFDGTFPLIDG